MPANPSSQGRMARIMDSDLVFGFLNSKLTVFAAVIILLLLVSALLTPWIAPYDPYDPTQLFIMDSHIPPVWAEGGDWRFLLGTDDQGRDLFSAMLYGLRLSLTISLVGIFFATILGVGLGLIAGYVGGAIDALIMRIADIQLTFPAILVALLIDGAAHGALGGEYTEDTAFMVLVVSIALSFWVKYARVVRGSVLVERNKEYVQAARLVGRSPIAIMFDHILPNVMGPILVILTINFGLAVIAEATLSFLGVGLPPTKPSLGTLIRVGQQFLFSGEWWVVVFPGILLGVLVLTINLVGDWLRDALNPKLR